PDGHVIIAGSAEPGIEVEVFANGDLVGKVMAEASGDWVLVPDHPLAVGMAEITVGIAGSNARSPHTFTVVIPEDKVSAPVITPSRSMPEAVEPPAVAAEPEPAPAAEALEPVPAIPAPAPETPVVADAPGPAPPSPEPVPVQQVEVPEPQPPAPAPASVEPPMDVAEAAPPAPTLPPAEVTSIPATPASIDAIEIDGTANYFAGAGPDGATVQLYVQDRFIASAKVEGGRWLVEAAGALTLPVQRVRIDLFKPLEAKVAARAEVNFVIDVPPPAPDVSIGGTGSGAGAPANSAAGDVAFAPEVESEPELDPTIPTLRALPSVAPEMMRFASGKAIIRRGETLWAIAARVYGDGRQYQRIVEANDELRRDPGRIYPGQVFDLPKLQDPAAAN
ncbi:MAG TPA: LysM peptidoglycan-binding domain-containing protein, partial [Devosia sp.]